MNIPLPISIAAYFEVGNGADPSVLAQFFTEHAVVHDENREYRGLESIQNWLREARLKYTYTAEPLDFVQQEATVKVRTRLTGNFPGSPVELKHLFRLADGRIDFLEIGE